MRRKTPIDQMIATKEAKLANAERNVDRLRIELATLREARQAVAEHPAAKSSAKPRGNGQTPEKRRGRSLSAQWIQVLTDIGAKGEAGASSDEILEFCKARGIDIKRPTLRAQMANYVSKKKYLERTKVGVFRLAPEGVELLEMLK